MILFYRTCTFSILVLALILYSASAQALSCPSRVFTLADAYEEADGIIIGIVTACEEAQSTDMWVGGGAGCSFSTLEVLKESNPTRDYGGVADSAACGLALQVGHQYLMFLDSNNQPLWYSEQLGRGGWADARVNQRIAILRDFRGGIAADLSEPWVFQKSIVGACTLSHGFRGNDLSFTRRPDDAVPLEEVDWGSIMADGKPVFGPAQIREIRRQVEERPEGWSDNELVMNIRFAEGWPRAARDASIRVGNRVWQLERQEHTPRVGNNTALDPHMFYYAKGKDAEEILAAMEVPSDIVATAIVAAVDGSSSVANPNTGQTSGEQASGESATASGGAIVRRRPGTQVFAPAPPSGGSTVLSPTEPQNGAARRPRRPPPEPVLRFKTRSTQLGRVTGEFRSCWGVSK